MTSRTPLASLGLVVLSLSAPAQVVFAPPATVPLLDEPAAVQVADFDLDGHLDLVAFPLAPAPFTSASVVRVLGEGDGSFGPAAGKLVGLSAVGEGQVADVVASNGSGAPDGLPDVVIGFSPFSSGSAGWVAGTPGGGLGSVSGVFFFDSAPTVDVQARDLDADGDLDLAALGSATIFIPGRIHSLLYASPGAWSASTATSTHTGSQFLELLHLDGDGLPDAAVSNAFSASLSLFAGKAGGGLLPPAYVTLGGTPRELASTDLDGDGLADLVVANESAAALQVLAGTGAGTPGAPQAFAVGAAPARLALGDLDGDGADDALVTVTSGEVRVLRGDGAGALLPAGVATLPAGLGGFGLGDLDQDGDLDAAFAVASGSAAVLLNASYPAGAPFTDLGHALKGTPGYPIQLAEGTLVAGEPFGFHLFNAKPGAITSHVVGLSAINLPYKGGTLVPAVDLINVLATDAAGEIHLAGPWPAGGSGVSLWLQFWVHDAGGVKGRAASSAVQAQIP